MLIRWIVFFASSDWILKLGVSSATIPRRGGDSGLQVFYTPVYFNGLETKISRTFLDFLHLGHEFFVISGHGTLK